MNPSSAAAAAAAAVAAQINAAIAAQQRLMAPPKPERIYFEEGAGILLLETSGLGSNYLAVA